MDSSAEKNLDDTVITDTTAIVLAGGKGSRMNFEEKAWVIHRGKPLIMHVIDQVKPQVSGILVSRNRPDPRYDDLPFICIADENSNFDGPLAGVAACLKEVQSPFTLIVPCDTPNLPGDLVPVLKANLGNSDVCIAVDEDRDQPLIMLAKTRCLRTMADYLRKGGRSVHGWLERQTLSRAQFAGAQLHNINEGSQLE